MEKNNRWEKFQDTILVGIKEAGAELSNVFDNLIEAKVQNVRFFCKSSKAKKFLAENYKNYFGVYQNFIGNIEGTVYIVFPEKSVNDILNSLVREEKIEKDFLEDILMEVSNIFTNNLIGVVGSLLSEKIYYSLPDLCRGLFMTKTERNFVLLINSVLNFKVKKIEFSLLIEFGNETFKKFKKLYKKTVDCDGKNKS